MRTIKWTCTVTEDWRWRSGSEGNPTFPATDDNVRTGTITLPPNPDYWYPCVELHVNNNSPWEPNGIVANAYLRYFKDDEGDKVQAIGVGHEHWQADGPVDARVSLMEGYGFNVLAELQEQERPGPLHR